MASASFQLSSDDGSTYLAADTPMADANALAYVSSGTYSCKAKLASTAGVGSVQWVITSADDVHYDALPTVTTNADKSCSFVVPKTGGAWLLRCIVNGGVNIQTGAGDGTLDRAMAIKVLNSAGKQEIAVGEQQEADAAKGYTKAWNDVARGGGVTSIKKGRYGDPRTGDLRIDDGLGIGIDNSSPDTFAFSFTASNAPYTPTTSGDWADPPPTTIQEAIDALAARVKALEP